jgi:hypothetical protein
MTAAELAAMYRGDLTLFQCLAWAARYPDEVPTLNGEWWSSAIRTPEVAELEQTPDQGEARCRIAIGGSREPRTVA